jgi:uncharacterized protein (DUF1810 family)
MHDLQRFVDAQQGVYQQALAEIQRGRKQSHWMWFVFPQYDGLGFSEHARLYAIKSLEEAKAYLAHPLLGPRLLECAEAVLKAEGRTAHEIFGSPDDLKLHSCATLFAAISPPGSVFEGLLDRFFGGVGDEKTRRLIDSA